MFVSARVGAKGDGGESARINERAGGEAVREDLKPPFKTHEVAAHVF